MTTDVKAAPSTLQTPTHTFFPPASPQSIGTPKAFDQKAAEQQLKTCYNKLNAPDSLKDAKTFEDRLEELIDISRELHSNCYKSYKIHDDLLIANMNFNQQHKSQGFITAANTAKNAIKTAFEKDPKTKNLIAPEDKPSSSIFCCCC